jgi:hypothetical protein
MVLGFTNRAVQSVAELDRALTLDRNLAGAHALIGQSKLLMRSSAWPRSSPALSELRLARDGDDGERFNAVADAVRVLSSDAGADAAE